MIKFRYTNDQLLIVALQRIKKKKRKKSNIIDTYLPKNTAELNTVDSHSLFYNFGHPSKDKEWIIY